jgi:pyruvate formate lyase activating enzyme
MVGRVMDVEAVLHEVLKDRVFFEESGGGVTVSGGEPLAQPEFLLELLEACRGAGIHTALDTTGFGRLEHLLAAARLSNLVLYDLKAFDPERHRRLTGVSNRMIIENLRGLDPARADVWIRLPVVPGFNDDLDDLRHLAVLVGGLRCVTRVSLLPFHRTGLHKFARLGLAHGLEGVETPSDEVMAEVQRLFTDRGLPTQIGG